MMIGPARPLMDLAEARLSAAFQWWDGLRPPAGALPLAESLELANVPGSVMPHLAVCSGFTPDGRLRAEFIGTVAGMFGGGDAAGRFLDEFYPPATARVAADIFHRVEELRSPLAGIFELGLDGQLLMTTRRLYLPFIDAAGGICRFAAVLTYELTEAGRVQRPRMFQQALDIMRMELFPPAP
ncbi:hypothetical protein [Indioceanicola profundi]|uniref:hypothetical protein n=1 Tax=Indioceanicola profundi TaxID=2220096 RepID=UPI000E6AB063|nr:hypothetical protein [Indioceanicola profundi]